jgi:hypothetical protein
VTFWERVRWLIGRRREPSPDALAATLIADASHDQACAEAQVIRKGLEESVEVAGLLREHNASNRYDEWLRRVIAS